MPNATTLELPDEVYGLLMRRAVENGRTPEAEVREIVVRSLAAEGRSGAADGRAKARAAITALQDDVQSWFAGREPGAMVDALLAERRYSPTTTTSALRQRQARSQP